MNFFRQPRWVAEILKGQQNIMSALSDLQTAVTNLGTSISSEIAAVTAAIQASQNANSGAVSATDAEAVVASLQNLQKTVDAETAALTPAPAPAPATPAS
jgi:hypothetical protein